VIEPDQLLGPRLATEIADAPFDVAIECSGRADAMETALAHLDRGGRLVLSGTGMHRPRFDANRIILHELSITGTVEYTGDDFEAAIELLARDELPTAALLEPDDVPLDQLQRAMERLMSGELAGKVLVVPHA
jgi:threonine dehydrogenase-like Zn-dependent dehydrogenase